MQSTMNLLAEAEKVKDLSAWAQELGLAKRVLYTAKYREHLSPAVAGVLAEKLGLDVQAWIVVAALESEKESACKSRMVRKFLTGAALAGTLMGASGAATAAVANTAQIGEGLYLMLNINCIDPLRGYLPATSNALLAQSKDAIPSHDASRWQSPALY